MTKEEACKLLGCNKGDLAKILGITPSYLSRFDELTPHYQSVVDTRISLIDSLKEIDKLEKKCVALRQLADDAIELLSAR